MLFLYDSFQSEPLECLDTVVFYLKASIHSLELISALFIVGAGAKDAYTSDEVDPVNILILAAHTYSNVWLRIRKGWTKFMLRQVIDDMICSSLDCNDYRLIPSTGCCCQD